MKKDGLKSPHGPSEDKKERMMVRLKFTDHKSLMMVSISVGILDTGLLLSTGCRRN